MIDSDSATVSRISLDLIKELKNIKPKKEVIRTDIARPIFLPIFFAKISNIKYIINLIIPMRKTVIP